MMNLLAYAKGPLFRWMALAITAGVVLIAATSILLGSSGIGTLGERLGEGLDQAQGEVSATLAASLDEASGVIDRSASDIRAQVSGQLRASMVSELGKVQQTLEESLSESMDNLADLLSKVAVEPILAKQFATLVTYSKEANRNPRVLYAVFVRPDGSLLTRYLDRRNPRVRTLLEQGEGRSPIDRLLSAATADADVRDIAKDIRFEGRSIGSVRLGVDLSDIRARIATIDTSFATLVEASGAQVGAVLQARLADLHTGLESSFEQVRAEQHGLAQQADAVLNEASESLVWRLATSISVVGVMILIALLVFFTLRVIRPVHALAAAMREVAEGDGDLTRRLPDQGRDEIARVARAFNEFVGKVQGTLVQVRQTTSTLAESASRLTAVASGNNEHMQTHQGETAQVATAVTEMTSTVKEIAASAESAASSAVEADRHATQGRDVMRTTVAAIAQLADEVEEAATAINRLKENGDSIGSVLDVIRAIANQTNLLALNAAIEAARAGEQGRGFAVVADEVRTLASRTQQSTAEIQGMIEALQSGTQAAVSVMQQGLGQARRTVEVADTAGISLSKIAEAVTSINAMNHQISASADAHTAVADEIDRSVVRISDLAERAADGSSEVANDSQELVRCVDTLSGLIAQFKL